MCASKTGFLVTDFFSELILLGFLVPIFGGNQSNDDA